MSFLLFAFDPALDPAFELPFFELVAVADEVVGLLSLNARMYF